MDAFLLFVELPSLLLDMVGTVVQPRMVRPVVFVVMELGSVVRMGLGMEPSVASGSAPRSGPAPRRLGRQLAPDTVVTGSVAPALVGKRYKHPTVDLRLGKPSRQRRHGLASRQQYRHSHRLERGIGSPRQYPRARNDSVRQLRRTLAEQCQQAFKQQHSTSRFHSGDQARHNDSAVIDTWPQQLDFHAEFGHAPIDTELLSFALFIAVTFVTRSFFGRRQHPRTPLSPYRNYWKTLQI